MPRTKTELSEKELEVIAVACEFKKTSPAVLDDTRWIAQLNTIIEEVKGGQTELSERDWVEVYYALNWLAKHDKKDALALMEKIGPDGENMYA